eukprot:TRINITY_DN1784_c1_g1_i1.p1 TRINITY_DN1784_c1_g1~~TRINITY_DN1784_c1_g1_i1.p1  ORF type:complete len:354 (-),score=71.64 TRINITY_DN1784_c1_g1_i1:72-1133(-)
MKHIFLIISLIVLVHSDDTHKTTEELITENGYPCEDHNTITSDGFTLSIQRIPNPTSNRVVMLQHGLLDTTATWVLNGPSESLGFILSDKGYDVWLVNVRMNTYSSPSGDGSYDWSFDEHALYDIPAAISYIHNQTSHPISIVAHSQGATTTLAHLATDNTMNSIVQVVIALGPVTYLANEESPLFKAMVALHVDTAMHLLEDTPFSPSPSVLSRFLGVQCEITPSLCNSALSELFGPTDNLNSSRMGIYTAHWPDRTSTKNMIQWIQNARSGGYNNFYNQPYNVSEIGVPVAVLYGTDDYLADPVDVQSLISQIPQLLTSQQVDSYAHMDFVWASSAVNIVYPTVLQVLEKF